MQTAWPYPFWIAHRGAGKLAPENTLAAFRLGAQHGYRMFECDVQLSADGVLFLLHDLNLERTSNGFGLASDQPWSALSRLDAGSWHSPAYVGEPLASLENTAQYCLQHDCFLNLEIKPAPGLEAATATALAHDITRLWPKNATPPLVSSFNIEALVVFGQLQPQLPRALLLDALPSNWLACALDLGCSALVCDYRLITSTTLAQAKHAGLRTLGYTVNSKEVAQRLMQWGLDGVITDRVDVFAPGTS